MNVAVVTAGLILGVAFAIALYIFRTELREQAELVGIDRVPGWIAVVVTSGSFLPVLLGDLDVSLVDGVAFCGILLGSLTAATGYSRRDLASALRDGPDDTRSLTEGPAVVSGEAVPAEGTTAGPFTGEPALCYEWGIDERRYTGKRRTWATAAFGSGGVDFLVRDEYGEVRVDPEGADYRLHDEIGPSSYADTVVVDDGDPPDPISDFLEASVSVGPTSDRRRYKETRLEPGSDVTVVGSVDYERGQYETEPVLSDPADGDFYVIDRSYEDVDRMSRLLVRYGIVGGALVTLASYAWLLQAAGVVTA